MKAWYVVATEPKEADNYVNVFGPFYTETDARAFAMDLADDNGWKEIDPKYMTHDEAEAWSTEVVIWPYKSGDEEDE